MSDNDQPAARADETRDSNCPPNSPITSNPTHSSLPPQNAPCSQLDAAVSFMLPGTGRRNQDDYNVEVVHDMDTRWVQTASTEMCEGDTLILLNVPEGHRPNRSCAGGTFPFSYRLRLPSATLRSCGFALFPRLMDDQKYQAKGRRRLAAKEPIPAGIEYILDLGPSTDEDLQSAHLETLTLSRGLTRWYKTHFVPPAVSHTLVSGHDDCCECASGQAIVPPLSSKGELGCLWDRLGIEPAFRDIEDYCEVRHAANVVRLLRRILGKPSGQLVLDSAPRVFTITGLAKLFDITFSPESLWLRDDVLSWFLRDGNSEIMEILAEDAILMGYSVMIPEVTRAAYRVLASEYALQLEASSPAARGGRTYSVFGRPLRDINSDMIQTAIEHGGQALARRILETLAHLQSDDVLRWLRIEEWGKVELLLAKMAKALECDGPSNDIDAIQAATAAMKKGLLLFIRSRIEDAKDLSKVPGALDVYKNSIAHFLPADHANPNGFEGLWDGLNDNQKALTSIFWKSLATRWPGSIEGVGLPWFRLKTLAKNLNNALSAHGFNIRHYVPEYFDIQRLALQIQWELDYVCQPIWNIAKCSKDSDKQELQHLFISSHMLLGLNESEMRFLPLWAGGMDDGSGGVYEMAIPMSDLGASGPGPAFHTGQTIGTETTNSTVGDLGMGDMDIKSYTTGTQTGMAHRGPSSVGPSTGGPAASEDMDFDDARYAVPADHQAIGKAVADTVQPADSSDDFSDVDSDLYDFDENDEGSGAATPTASVIDTMDIDRAPNWSMT